MSMPLKLTAVLVCSIALGSGAYAAATRVGLTRSVPVGLRIDGREVDVDQPLGAWVDARRRAVGGREVTLSDGHGEYRRVTYAELGIELDTGDVLRRALTAVDVPLPRRPALAQLAREGQLEVSASFRVDRARAAIYLASLAPLVRRDPVNARLDLMGHERIADVPGTELDVDATVARLEALHHVEGEVVELATHPVQAAFTLAHVADVDVSKVLASAETTFTLWGTGAGRAVNIKTAARRIDGWVIAPGETFSFNDVVGPRTLEAGFTHAPEIVGDELEMGVGGGTCQVASTLHGAALHGALDVVERHNHGRPSSYTKMGLDATVAYGKVDLKIKNPFSFPLIVHAYLPKPTAVRVEVLGAEPQATVAYSYAINKTDDFFRRLTYKPQVPAGKMVLHQKGNRGYEVVSRVATTWPDGRVTERTYFSGYRPVPEVYWVGRDFDENQLPDLPSGAARVERRGVPAPAPASAPTPPPQENG